MSTLRAAFGTARSAALLDDDRLVVALLGKRASENGGERCSIVALASGAETVIDPRLYAQGNGGVAYDAANDRILFTLAGVATLYDAQTGTPLDRFSTGGQHGVTCVSFSPDGALLCVGSQRRLAIWNTSDFDPAPAKVQAYFTHEPSRPPAFAFDLRVARVRFSPDGSLLAIGVGTLVPGLSGGGLKLWSTAERRIVTEVSWEDPVVGLDFAPDGKTILVALTTARWVTAATRSAGEGRVHVVSLGGETLRTWIPQEEILDLRFLADGRLCTVGGTGVAVIDAEDGKVLARRAQKPTDGGPRIADVRGNRVLTVGPIGVFDWKDGGAP